MAVEADPMLRRYERNQVVVTLVMAAVAAAFRRFDLPLSILGGGLLMAISYRAIKGGVDAIVGRRAEGGTNVTGQVSERRLARRRLILLAKFVGRYALLALAAYVMLVRLHAHPVGLLLGAASPVVAVGLEAVRIVRAWSRPGQS